MLSWLQARNLSEVKIFKPSKRMIRNAVAVIGMVLRALIVHDVAIEDSGQYPGRR